MSELTPCNYCSLLDMQSRAEERGVDVILYTYSSGEWEGWTSARFSDKEEPSHYFMKLTDHCVC